MSEAELHVVQARMRGGLVNKARREELRLPLPVDFLYDAEGQSFSIPTSRPNPRDGRIETKCEYFVAPGL
jgi:hypothetical protein